VPSTQFESHIKDIVSEFLETVVVLDDEALDSTNQENDSSVSDDQQDAPSDGGAATGGLGVDAGLREPRGENERHQLPAKEVIDAFAEHGLVCSLLDPDDAVENRLLKTASRADLLVIDWWIYGSVGGRALELIKAVLTADEKSDSRRLRVIAIYTGEADLVKIADSVASTLDTVYPDLSLEREDNALSMSKGPVRVTILAKEHVRVPLRQERPNKVKVGELPERLAEEYARLATGLVSAVAIKSLAALRQDTHRILEKLGPALDLGYLGHRVAQRRPPDAEGHLTEMVAAEFASILADSKVGAKADRQAIHLWLKWATKSKKLKPGQLFPLEPKLTVPQIKKMLQMGLGDDDLLDGQLDDIRGRKKKHLEKIRDDATKLFALTDSEADSSNGIFAERMMLRTTYRNPRRELRLGTIVFRGGRFLLCVQPVCDSVRLPKQKTASFPFLPLSAPKEDDIDLIVPHPLRPEWVPLAIQRKPRTIEMIEFDPNGEGVVPAYKQGTSYRFVSESVGYRWVADLKPHFAHRVASELGHQFSRIGLNEPELLRLSRGS
jgi:Response receiver domain